MNLGNRFSPKPTQPKKENCRIRVKKTPQGKEIEFKGNCSKEQIDVARSQIGLDDE